MKWLDAVYASPAENLACDEALLDLCEEEGVEILRFWESRQHFVVAGYANKIESEVNVEECRRRGVPILRRCSGGGTVVQGPGCLNYNLTLRVEENSPLATVTGTNEFVMERNRAALEQLLGLPVAVRGHTDLAFAEAPAPPALTLTPSLNPNLDTHEEVKITRRIKSRNETARPAGWIKFSGNAQRRRRRALVFHGTILHDFDLGLIDALLRFPSRQPNYRHDRAHGDFVRNIPAHAEHIRECLRHHWRAEEVFAEIPHARVAALVRDRYARDDWNLKH